jgi:hypothetical protein
MNNTTKQAYQAADAILMNCSHDAKGSEIKMPGGKTITCCCDCWNQHVYARRAARKAELAEHNAGLKVAGTAAMSEVGAKSGDQVRRFFPSFIGIGGIELTGQIVMRRGLPYVRFDQKYDGRREMMWSKSWGKVA